MPSPQVQAILDRNADAATVAWALDGRGDLAALADPELAISAAEAAGNAAALQAVVAPKALRKAAAAALHRLRSRGVKVEQKAPAAFVLAPEEVDVPSRAFLGLPDSDGEVTLVLTATNRGGTCLMELHLGRKDARASHGHANRGELRDIWKTLEADASLAEVPFGTGLHLATEALAGRDDHGWRHFLEKVPAEVQAAARTAPPPAPAVEEAIGADRVWILPVALLAAPAIEFAARTLLEAPGSEAARGETWLPEAADLALQGEARADLADAADRFAKIYGFLGRHGAAADAERLAGQLRGDIAGRELVAVRNSVQRGATVQAMRVLQDFLTEQQQR